MSRSHFHDLRLPRADQTRVLRSVIDRAKERTLRGPPVVVFDLDGTLMDNRPRVVAILHELADEWRFHHPEAAEACARATPEQIGYGFIENLRRLGVTKDELHDVGLAFWKARFFADPHMKHDVEVAGARDFVHACYKAGGIIIYFTGRDLPNMALGSFASLRDLGFPIGVVGTELVTKPAFEIPDTEFKRGVAPEFRRLGEVIAVFDNEPANCNLFLDAYPDCTSVLLDTQCAPDPPPPDPRVHVVGSFEVEP
ncbi:MAG: haloacid dehalogenase-like hydrolase [Polyangiaceae bacterium]|nr:haloacid dehalogenase-like hydrolase [Polyangiaceae bacterium]NUQ77393.1 haloacid dehalogenase-like hydrolase [Polyangiaceae bacterium]